MSQSKQIKHYLKSGGKLTQLDALQKFQCFRLAAVVHILREEGFEIKTKMLKKGNKSYAEYSMQTSGDLDLFGGK